MKVHAIAALVLVVMLTFLFSSSASAEDGVQKQASKLFKRITGVPLGMSDPKRAEMENFISAGLVLDAALVAANDPAFVNVTMRNFSTLIFDRDRNPYAKLNDGMATLMVYAAQEKDFRGILRDDVIVTINGVNPAAAANSNTHYENAERDRIDLSNPANVTLSNQSFLFGGSNDYDAAGVLTSRAWAAAHMDAGTNRRALEKAFEDFLCTPMTDLADSAVATDRIRQDVDRSPGGNAGIFVSTCKTCHSVMDGLSGAFCYFDFVNGRINYTKGQVQTKCVRNAQTFQAGYQTTSDNWINNAVQNHNEALGWRTSSMSGYGVNALGNMLAESKAFSRCMVKRVFKEICNRETTSEDSPLVEKLAQKFENDDYNMKRLFAHVAITNSCTEE